MTGNEWLAIGMVGGFFGFLVLGVPVAISLAISGFAFGIMGFGTGLFNLLPARVYGVVTNYTLLALPLFIFMGVMLEKSKLAEELIDVIGHAMGRLKGGMGLAIVIVGVLMGASSGVVGATVVTVGLLSLQPLINRGYDKGVASGVICASGTLGQIIPPSLVLILLADILGESVGTLFAAAMVPGLILAGMLGLYLVLLGIFKPEMVPAIPQDERDAMNTQQLLLKIAKVVVPPLALVFAVLGSIVGGIAAPTEAASMGALGALLLALFTGRLNLRVMRDVLHDTLITSAMVFFILICAQPFGLAFRGLGGEGLVHAMFEWVPGGDMGNLLFMMGVIFVLGFFLEWIEISYIALPMFLPVFQYSGIDMAWLAILVAMNLQTSFLTPPFGWALFFLKGVAPKSVSTVDIYRGVIPFIGIQAIALVLLFIFPELTSWLPNLIGW
ncbi:TRAP transporter large permease subunit [Thalassospira sp.]|uniref:TRAP transporter large permease n=1 Tax=Thalassospira sp. TaxID=1912094 RepID=UPI000C57EEC9|nr:TRAP transporter large permease subunit [Thalassospira sp.]MBC06978.1 C4-dicarboxylate ABC transporter [Thalassospira sp.]|tara:strand:- start:5287 stop:6612 length:1326 start_codon:yes stop_codon:yes gene_type:complete